jgi:putative transposase
LTTRSTAWRERRENITYSKTSTLLSDLKKAADTAWLSEVSSVPLQQALRHVQVAYSKFWKGATRHPHLKRKKSKQSAEFTRSAFTWDPERKSLSLAKIGRLNVIWHRDFASEPTIVTITKSRSNKYYVSLSLDEEFTRWPKTGNSVGIDLGLSTLATLSTGEKITRESLRKKFAHRIARKQRALARRVCGSNRWHRARKVLAREHERIANVRMDTTHKITSDIVKRFDVIAIEDLAVLDLCASGKASKYMMDAGLSEFRKQIQYKANYRGRTVLVCQRFYPSSKRCSNCGYVLDSLQLGIRTWTCQECGEKHDRDVNAAKNILAAGQAVTARGGIVSPPNSGGKCRRGANRATNRKPRPISTDAA